MGRGGPSERGSGTDPGGDDAIGRSKGRPVVSTRGNAALGSSALVGRRTRNVSEGRILVVRRTFGNVESRASSGRSCTAWVTGMGPGRSLRTLPQSLLKSAVGVLLSAVQLGQRISERLPKDLVLLPGVVLIRYPRDCGSGAPVQAGLGGLIQRVGIDAVHRRQEVAPVPVDVQPSDNAMISDAHQQAS